MKYPTSSLRGIAERVGLAHIKELVRVPGVKSVYRITAYHSDITICGSVSTITETLYQLPKVEVIHEGLFDNRPRIHSLSEADFRGFTDALRHAGFSDLENQIDSPIHNASLWLVEKAMGGYYKGLLVSPEKPDLPYTIITNAISDYMPYAVREIKQSERT